MPLITMIVAMLLLSVNGMQSTKNLWCSGFLAIIASFFVYKDKKRFQTALVGGVGDNIFTVMILILLLSGILSKILTVSNLVSALLWLVSRVNLSANLLPFLCFIMAVMLTSATGSCVGTLTAVIPAMPPMATAMGCNPAVICGAILSGGCFGDNLAPISDTTIASSLTQEINVSRVARSGVKYSLAGGIPCAILFLIVVFVTTNSSAAETLAVESTHASSLVFWIIPVLIVLIMLRKSNFFTAILISEMIGTVMLLIFWFVNLKSLFATDGIITGFEGMLSSIIFMMLIFIGVSPLREAGYLQAV